MDPRIRYIRIVDVTTVPSRPSLAGSIDLQPYAPFSNTVSLRMSANGLYVLACIRSNGYISGLGGVPGRVLVIDKDSWAVVGNAVMTTGPVGDGSTASGARDCVEDAFGNLYVTNSNSSTHNIVEVFDMSTILTNGFTPTTSYFTIQCPNHAEELCFDGSFIWTSEWSYGNRVQRIDPNELTVKFCTDPTGRNIYGVTFALGHLWATSQNGSPPKGLIRLNPSLFVPDGVANMAADVLDLTMPGFYTKNNITSDGTNLWVATEGGAAGVSTVWKIDPTPGALAILATVPIQFPGDTLSNFNGPYHLASGGGAIWGTNRWRGASGNGGPGGQPSTLIKVNPSTGAQELQWAGPPKAVWVGDKETPTLFKIDTSDPANPVILTQIDLSGYGAGVKRVRVARHGNDLNPTAFPFIEEDNHNLVFVAMMHPSGAPLVIVDASTNAIVGAAFVDTDSGASFPTDFAFGIGNGPVGGGQDNGFVYVLSQTTSGSQSTVVKYVWQEILDAFPTVYSSYVDFFHFGVHVESITYGGHQTGSFAASNFIWGCGWESPAKLYRMHPTTGAITTYTGTGRYFAPLFAFGSVWVTGANSINANKIFRFDPATFPSAPTVIVVDPTNTVSNTCEMAADASTIWVSNGSNFVTNLPILYRVSTGLGTEAVIASVSIDTIAGTTQGVAFDGQVVWATLRYGDFPVDRGIAAFSTGVGTEALIAFANPGNLIHDPTSMAVQ
jgi:hypothetical protein